MEEPRYHLSGVVKTRQEEPEDFDGPLDLILLLLSRNKIEIQDVSITSILEQYLGYLEEMKRLDMEIASEFIAMASHLMLIKTKMLLSLAEQEEAMSEMELLIRSLEDRQRKEAFEQIRQAAQFLEARGDVGRGCFTKPPEPLRRDSTYRYQHEAADLVHALDVLADRAERQLPPPVSAFEGIMAPEPFSITKKTAQILRRLLSRGVLRLRQLFQGAKSRSEIVATFMAVLELCRLRSVAVEGEADEVRVQFLRLPEEEAAQPKE